MRSGSDDVDFVLLRDSYHMVTLDNEKDLVAAETARFFRDRVLLDATDHLPAKRSAVG